MLADIGLTYSCNDYISHSSYSNSNGWIIPGGNGMPPYMIRAIECGSISLSTYRDNAHKLHNQFVFGGGYNPACAVLDRGDQRFYP